MGYPLPSHGRFGLGLSAVARLPGAVYNRSRMEARRISFKQWFKAVTRHALDDDFSDLTGYPVGDAAKRLKVSDQRVRQLIESGQLEAIQITTAAGTVAMTLVTESSLDAYEPRPTGRPLKLALSE